MHVGACIGVCVERSPRLSNWVRRTTILYYRNYTISYTILYYTILYYTILYYTILYYTISYTILYYTILYYANYITLTHAHIEPIRGRRGTPNLPTKIIPT